MQRLWRSRGVWMRWLLAALAETAVVIPWMLFLYASGNQPGWVEGVPGTWLPLLVYLTAGLWESGNRSERPAGRVVAMIVGAVLSYLAAYGALPAAFKTGVLSGNPAMAFLIVGAYLWYRGARSAIEGLNYGQLFSKVYIPFITQLVGILLLMALGLVGEGQVQLLLVWAVVLLFAAGLTLLILTRERALQAEESSREQGGTASVSPAVTALVLGMLLFTLVASSLLTVERLDAILDGVSGLVSPVYTWLVNVALLVVVRWAKLLEPLFNAVQRWASGVEPPPPAPEDIELGADPPEPLPVVGPTPDYTPLVRALLLVIALLLLARWLYRLNRGQKVQEDVEEERTSLGFWQSLLQDVRSLFGRSAAATASAETDDGMDEVDPRGPRGLFRRLQRWGAAQGRPRRPSETPNRYQESLASVVPAAERPAAQVAAVYNQERYGATPPDQDAVAVAAGLLDEIDLAERK